MVLSIDGSNSIKNMLTMPISLNFKKDIGRLSGWRLLLKICRDEKYNFIIGTDGLWRKFDGTDSAKSKIRIRPLEKDKVITFASEDEGSIIEMAAKGTKLKKSLTRIKPARIIVQNYQLMSNGKAMRLTTIDGGTLI